MKKIALFVAGVLMLFLGIPNLGLAYPMPTLLEQKSTPKAKTFSGTILKRGDSYILNDSASKVSYMLDDAEKASQFEGKKVKVTGTVDVATNTIHVETIQEVA